MGSPACRRSRTRNWPTCFSGSPHVTTGPRRTETIAIKAGGGLEALSFQFDLASAKPRLNALSFMAAANWLGTLASQKCMPLLTPGVSSDPAAALADNRAALAVLSLGQLAKLPREARAIPERYGVAPLPGTRSVFDPQAGRLSARAIPNYVPYFAGGRLGVVRTRCSNHTAAFDLLAELGGPTRSLEIVAAPELGAGPFRVSHLDRDRLHLWYGYGFDSVRSDALRKALERYVNVEVRNPTYGLRGPDRSALSASAAREFGKMPLGTPADEVRQRLLDDWNQTDTAVPLEKQLKWRKFAAGLD